MPVKDKIKWLFENYEGSYSDELGIKPFKKTEKEIFKLFLAAFFFGKPISETSAKKTFKTFIEAGADNPDKILRIGSKGRLKLIRKGGYTRYDFQTDKALKLIMQKLKEDYGGKVTNVRKAAKDEEDLREKLQEFHGVGPVTVDIFFRELRKVWNVNPGLSDNTIKGAVKLKLIKTRDKDKALRQLERIWKENRVGGKSFADFEAALYRHGKGLKRKKKISNIDSFREEKMRKKLAKIGNYFVDTVGNRFRIFGSKHLVEDAFGNRYWAKSSGFDKFAITVDVKPADAGYAKRRIIDHLEGDPETKDEAKILEDMDLKDMIDIIVDGVISEFALGTLSRLERAIIESLLKPLRLRSGWRRRERKGSKRSIFRDGSDS